MFSSPSHLIIGYHACDRLVGEQILSGEIAMQPGRNPYDWLGFGCYFWENDQQRAFEYAQWLSNRKRPPQINTPFVIGAVINPGDCLNLLERRFLQLVQEAHHNFIQAMRYESKRSIPKNKPLKDGKDLVFRELDCTVINFLHNWREKKSLASYDTVRGVFWEGQELYPNAGFKSHNHVQICVRNPACIAGYFRPLNVPA